MALQKVKDSMRTTVALDATKLAGAVPTGSLGNAVAADDSITLAKMAPGTDGQVITYSAAGDPVAIGPGTAGQVLTSAGANLPQTFADAAGGAWAVKGSGSAAGFDEDSALIITNITKTIKVYLNYIPSLALNYGVSMKTSTDGGTNWGGAPSYDVANITGQHGSSTLTYDRTNNSGMVHFTTGTAATPSNVSGSNVFVEVTVHSPESNRAKLFSWDIAYPTTIGQNDNLFYTGIGKASWNGTAAINAVKFYPLDGTFSAGTYVVLELN